jgi:hypothetical protein
MGNCRSSPQKEAPVADTSPPPPLPLPNSEPKDDASTAALINVLVPIILPIAQKIISQQLINDKMVIKDEILVEELDEKNLPLGSIEFNLDDIHVLSYETLAKDINDMPEFAWPETERLQELMKDVPGVGRGMVALDMTGVKLRLHFGVGIELVIPVDGPLGMKCNLEVGAGGSIKNAWVQVEIPKLRMWFVSETQKLYVAFLERPNMLPCLQVNADRGNGDFMNMEFTAHGTSLDDIVESVLCGFGPSSITMKEDEQTKTTKKKRSWIGDALGRRISQAIGAFAGVGNNRPLEVDLHETVQSGIDSALGKPRPIEEIRADIKALEEELAAVKKSQQTNEEEKKDSVAERDAMVEDSVANNSAPSLLCCGLGL